MTLYHSVKMAICVDSNLLSMNDQVRNFNVRIIIKFVNLIRTTNMIQEKNRLGTYTLILDLSDLLLKHQGIMKSGQQKLSTDCKLFSTK